MDLLAQGTERGAQPVAAFRDTMFGDLLGISASVIVLPNTRNTLFPGSAANAIADQTGQPVVIRAPLSTRYNGIKISDNESPAPQDRVSFSYNYYYGVNQSLQPAGFPRVTGQRQVMGFEKTFLDGDISIGMRQPFVQIYGDSIVNGQTTGDLSVIFKGRLWADPVTGDLLSAGMVVTAPTGNVTAAIVNGVEINPKSTLFQPFLGFIRNYDRGFAQGFGSIVVPNRADDTTILFNSIGVGYWLYREPDNRFLTGITPVAELHVSTPLNNRSPNDVLYFQDQANITTGSYFSFRRLLVGTAFGIPMVGPRPWNFEWILNMNYRF